MKIFIISNRDRSKDTANLVFAFTTDSKNNLLVFSLIKNQDQLKNSIDFERINNKELGYNDAINLLTGNYELNFEYKPKIHETLLIQDPEIFGTDDIFKPLRVSFLNKRLFGSGELSACELYGFNKLNGVYYNANSRLSLLEAINLYSESFNTKRHPRNIKTTRYQALVGFPFPNSDLDSEESFLAVFPNENTKLIFNIKSEILNLTYNQFYLDYLPNKFITCKLIKIQDLPDKSSLIKVISLANNSPVPNIPISLSTDSGYISNTKIVTNPSGEFIFKYIPLGLSSGDISTISAGFKLFTGVCDLKIKVK